MLRDYQSSLNSRIDDAAAKRVLAVLPTGGGKTVCMSHQAANYEFDNIAIAHRQELTSQISMAFARQGLEHRIIAPNATIDAIRQMQVDKLGKNWVHPGAPVGVAGVDTLIKRIGDPWLKKVRRWQIDEAHHLQPENKWGRACSMFPNAEGGIGWTATPCRTDRRGLDGCFDELIVGPTMRELINRGYLCEYQVYGVKSALNLSKVKVGANGEFVQSSLAKEMHEGEGATITGDAVEHYLRLAYGKRCVGFVVDVQSAHELVAKLEAAGVKAAALHAKTPGGARRKIIEDFELGNILYIANVDVLGEGFDCPAIECVQMLRPTMSYGLYVQQFGRALRILLGKLFGIIIDHVGNVLRHGLPDGPREWSLAGPPRRVREAEVAINVCGDPSCMRVYEGFEPECPFCGWRPERRESAGREAPAQVAGDLTLYTPEMLAQLRGEAARIAGPVICPPGLRGGPAAGRLMRNWDERREAQGQLRDLIDAWGGRQVIERGDSIAAAYRRFHHMFGIDTLGALSQSGPDMRALYNKIKESL